MDDLINLLEATTKNLIEFNMTQYSTNAQLVVDNMMQIFPQIILYYSDERMADISNEALYWPAQIERVINALEKGDDIATVDVLYNETRSKLLELKNELIVRGIL